MFYIYFIKSKRNGKTYMGVTEKDPKDRLKEHNCACNKWTKENGPLKLIYFESYCCKKDALAREKFYKSGFGKLIKESIIKTIEDHDFWSCSSAG
jgi:putative endonuclease